VSPGRLPERDRIVSDLGLCLKQWILDGREGQLASPELDPRDADVAAAGVAVDRRLAVLELDPRTQLVRLSECIGLLERLQVVELSGGGAS